MAKYTIHDRRRFERQVEQLDARVQLLDTPAVSSPFETSTENVSERGLRFPMEQEIHVGTEVDVELHLDANASHETMTHFHGKVIWTKQLQFGEPYHVGIELDGSSEELDALRDYLQRTTS